MEYELCAYQGNKPETVVSLQKRTGAMELVTNADEPPYPKVKVLPPIEVDLTWLLGRVSASFEISTTINRQSSQCLTPRRNPEVSAALRFLEKFSAWSHSVADYFNGHLFQVELSQRMINPDMSILGRVNDILIPVVPLFEAPKIIKIDDEGALIPPPVSSSSAPKSVALKMEDTASFLLEQKRGLAEKFSELTKVFPALVNKKVVSVVEAKIVVLANYAQKVAQQYSDSVDYIEQMLYSQLRAAIGKEVSSADFADYMKYHNRKFFRREYQPRAFSYAIARKGFSPEGVISIEAAPLSGTAILPIQTIVSESKATKPMMFALNAGTNISFFGDRFLHGWVSHAFKDDVLPPLTLTARARAFSCFFLMVGRIVAADMFDPKCALIIKNKDDLQIPLVLETIPTPKEFRDAIESMSQEQQRFCKAYRGTFVLIFYVQVINNLIRNATFKYFIWCGSTSNQTSA